MDLVRNYPVEVSILFGNIEILSGVPFGTLTIDMKGEGKDILDAVAYLKSREIKVEELGGHKIEERKEERREEDKIWNG